MSLGSWSWAVGVGRSCTLGLREILDHISLEELERRFIFNDITACKNTHIFLYAPLLTL